MKAIIGVNFKVIHTKTKKNDAHVKSKITKLEDGEHKKLKDFILFLNYEEK